jgi:hypothetical protein
MRPAVFVLSVLLLPGLTGATSPETEGHTVTRIDIDASWGGLGMPGNAQLTIRESGGRYLLGGRVISSVAVDHLLRALQQPSILQPDLENLGLTLDWLDSNATDGPPTNQGPFTSVAPNLRALYRRSFTDLSVITRVVPSLFKYVKTDDYPSARVVVTLQNGSRIRAASDSYYVFMLPWKVNVDGPGTTSFNADISRSVAALMPEGTTNRERLMGHDLLTEIQNAVMRHIEGDWNLLDAENRAGPAMVRLREQYDVVAAEVSPYHNVEYGKEWKGGRAHEENLHATLRKPNFPANFTDAVVLLHHRGQTEGVEAFLRSVKKYEDLVFSVPWLKALMVEQPRVQYRLSYVHDASFCDKAMGVFTADMRKLGKRRLAEEIRSKQSEITLLMTGMKYYESYWLLLPDKRMILWRYRGATGLLKWGAVEFSGGECSEYEGMDQCVGNIVSADGVLVRDPPGERPK